MKRAYLYFYWMISCLIFWGCSQPEILTVPEKIDKVLVVSKWKVIGPFEFDTLLQVPDVSFRNRDLELYGIDEDHFKEDDFRKLGIKHSSFIVDCPNSTIKLFNYCPEQSIKNKSNFYLFTTVYSVCDQEVIFMLDGSRNYKVWVNKEQIQEVLSRENMIKQCDRFLRVKLNKGNNSIFVKVNRGTNNYSWGILTTLTSEKIAYEIFKEKYFSDFINDPIIQDSLSLYLGPFAKGRLIITDENNIERYNEICVGKSQNIIANCKKLSKGLFSVKLVLGLDTLKQPMYKGSIVERIEEIKLEVLRMNLSKRLKEDIEASIDRLDFLFENMNESSDSGRRYYHRNILYYFNNLLRLITFVKNNNSSSFFPGTIIKTYDGGEKDSIIYQFMLHTNEKILKKDSPMPIIFFIPYELTEESLTRSWYLGNLDQITLDIRDADDYGFAVVWLFLKGKKYKDSMDGLTDLKRAITILQADYNIDTTQIYLNGECVGGQRALLIAEQCPDLFAGVSVRCPITTGELGTERPIDLVQKLKNVPVAIVHGKYDDRVPIQDSKDFVTMAKKYGHSQIKLVETESGHLTLANNERRYLYVYFDSIRDKPSSQK